MKKGGAVKWGIVKNIVSAWVMTIPITAAIGAGAFSIVDLLF